MGKPKRVVAFVDGFNLYHSICDLDQDHLKWLDLMSLVRKFAPAPDHAIGNVFYFSAFAFWRPSSQRRHKTYVAALRASGVTPVIGKFKTKIRHCRQCGATWQHHEEKESDVSLGVALVIGAINDLYDKAILAQRQ